MCINEKCVHVTYARSEKVISVHIVDANNNETTTNRDNENGNAHSSGTDEAIGNGDVAA